MRSGLRLAWLGLGAVLAARAQAAAPAGPGTVTLEPGQSLEDLAERVLGDREAADEIRALNRIEGRDPPAGTALRLPGPERPAAVSAWRVASQAVQLAADDGAEEFAPERLARAREALAASRAARLRADYLAGQRLADEAWAIARQARQESQERRPRKNRLAVSVDAEGATRVEVHQGDGVKVTAGKKSLAVGPGQAVRVGAGKEPEPPRALLPAPEPVLPPDGAVLVTPTIHFRWQPVEGAARYILLLSRDAAGLQPVRQLSCETVFHLFPSTLPDGTYYFFLRSMDGAGLVGPASPARRFQLQVKAGDGVRVESGPGGKGP